MHFLTNSVVEIVLSRLKFFYRNISCFCFKQSMLVTCICRFFVWSLATSFVGAAYLILALAVDRVLALVRPFWYRQLKFLKFARKTFIAVVAVSSIVAVSTLWTAEASQTRPCKCSCQRESSALTIVQTFLVTVVPMVILTASNGIFIKRLLLRRKSKPPAKFSRDADIGAKIKKKNSKERNYLKILLITSCSYMGLMFATAALSRVGLYFSQWEQTQNLAEFLWTLMSLPLVLNNSVNFGFYCLSGPMFRSAVKKYISKIQ